MDTAQVPQEETTVSETESQPSANRLVLPSLEIKNFRAFRHLTIEKLGRVNLITGKNNVGKTSLLEALWLYAERGSPETIKDILSNREEVLDVPNEAFSDVVTRFGSLSYGRTEITGYENSIYIGDEHHKTGIAVYIAWFLDVALADNPLLATATVRNRHGAVPCFVYGDMLSVLMDAGYKLPVTDVLHKPTPRQIRPIIPNAIPYQFVNSSNLTNAQQSRLWDKVALTPFEDDVETALRVLSPNIKRIAFVASSDKAQPRAPMVRVDGGRQAVPLRSLGEGVNRMLGYVLSAANAAGGILLIDEIENGLHYSVLPDVWRLIFQTARRLNVQVFATTHSWDCIEAFQQAASEDDDPTSGVLVRLRNKDGDIVSTVFDEEDLRVITRDGIEVR